MAHSQKKIDPPHPRGNITSFVTSSNDEHVRHFKNYRSTFDDVILRNVGGLIGDVIPLNLTDRLYIIIEYIIKF